jgi:hypothetical protein
LSLSRPAKNSAAFAVKPPEGTSATPSLLDRAGHPG